VLLNIIAPKKAIGTSLAIVFVTVQNIIKDIHIVDHHNLKPSLVVNNKFKRLIFSQTHA